MDGTIPDGSGRRLRRRPWTKRGRSRLLSGGHLAVTTLRVAIRRPCAPLRGLPALPRNHRESAEPDGRVQPLNLHHVAGASKGLSRHKRFPPLRGSPHLFHVPLLAPTPQRRTGLPRPSGSAKQTPLRIFLRSRARRRRRPQCGRRIQAHPLRRRESPQPSSPPSRPGRAKRGPGRAESVLRGAWLSTKNLLTSVDKWVILSYYCPIGVK